MMITVENHLVFTENLSAVLIIWLMLPLKYNYIFTHFYISFSEGSKLKPILSVYFFFFFSESTSKRLNGDEPLITLLTSTG